MDPHPTPTPELADRRPIVTSRRVAWGALPGLALALVALVAIPGTLAAPVPAAGGPAGAWAWGAFSNTTLVTQSAGAYADTLNLTGGNLSAASAYVVEAGALHAEYGAFAVVNVTTPAPGSIALEAQAVGVANLSGYLAVTGTLPAAGTYANGTPVRLANETSVYAAHLEEVSAYAVFANYSLNRSVLALENEQVRAWTGVNVTLVADNWPQYTADANGSTTVSYTTAAFAELAWVAEVVNVSFAPALPLAEFPLSVGSAWDSATTATVVGWAAYANVTAARVNGINVTAAHSGAASLNATAPLSVHFVVTGSQSVVFPNGTEETGDTVVATVSGGTGSEYTLWDGLVLLPTASGTTPSTPAPAAHALSRVAAVPASAPGTVATVRPSTGLPVSVSTPTGTGSTVATAPMTPAAAHAQIATAGTPAKPTESLGAPSTQVSPPAGTPPTTPGPAPAPATTSAVDPAVLAALVAGIAVVFLAVALIRERRRR